MSQDLLDAGGLYGATAPEDRQRVAVRNGNVPVAVYGLGKIGLPLASVFAEVTGSTVGVDVDRQVVDSVNDGDCPVEREPGLPSLLREVVGQGALRATTDGEAAADVAEVHVVIVPTLLTAGGEPDLSMLEAAVETVGVGLSPGDLVVVESTVPPRTTADVVVPRLAAVSGLDPTEFGAAACPERTLSGQAIADIRGTHPKVVGGVDAESTRVARLLYEEVVDNEVIPAASATMAEAVKVFEGVYRDVNIAIANQLARYAPALDVDTRRAIEIANTQPFCDILDPGPGVGGHCIPVYPSFLTAAFETEESLLSAARETNDAMPAFTVSMLEAMLEESGRDLSAATVLLLGVTYRANAADLHNAPALAIADRLRDRGATVRAADPLVDDWDAVQGVEGVPVVDAPARAADAVVLVTPHDEFDTYDWGDFAAPILDGRAAIEEPPPEATVYTLGDGWP